jgi:hypothetical protein
MAQELPSHLVHLAKSAIFVEQVASHVFISGVHAALVVEVTLQD